MIKKAVIFSILTIFIFICGCETVNTGYIEADKINNKNETDFQNGKINIVGVFLKDGKYIDMNDKNAKWEIVNNNKMISFDNEIQKRESILMSEINIIKVDIIKDNIVLSVLIGIGILIVIFLITHRFSNITG